MPAYLLVFHYKLSYFRVLRPTYYIERINDYESKTDYCYASVILRY
jgi:hypothetical protein